jgi:hypothetical protein
MCKDKYNLLITIGITFIIFLGFHLSKEKSLSKPVQLFNHKLEFAADFVTDASKMPNQSGEATVNDWDKLLHKVIDIDH